ncbi:MAG TPA: hypothetical protein DC053_06220 [Lachnoclostridium sp.]|nr:hypothetical protein [Lachnoclostridium sp.]
MWENIRINVENDGEIWNIISRCEIIFRNYLNSLTKRIQKYIMEIAIRKWQHLGRDRIPIKAREKLAKAHGHVHYAIEQI